MNIMQSRSKIWVRIGIVGGVIGALVFSTWLGMKIMKALNPGPLSSVHSASGHAATVSSEYVSHAEFENQCSHCHAPVHCVTESRCQDCHIEIARQRASASGLHSRLPGTSRCQTCHVEHQGRETVITKLAYTNVNHEKLANFSLARHQKNYDGSSMDCETCHSQDSFLNQTLDCVTCHIEHDHDAMSAHLEQYGTDCIACHDGADIMTDFDHEHVYPLEGKHADAECEDCHAPQQYHLTATTCVGCHQDPEIHAGLFGQECDRCHTPLAWVPAQLMQHTFVLDHSNDGVTECETCHAGTYTEYPCYSCHELADMQAAHPDESVTSLEENCVECHPTGRGNDVTASQDPSGGLTLDESKYAGNGN
jgi:hypothetical protein